MRINKAFLPLLVAILIHAADDAKHGRAFASEVLPPAYPPPPARPSSVPALTQHSERFLVSVLAQVVLNLTSAGCSSTVGALNWEYFMYLFRITTGEAWNASDAGQVEGQSVFAGDIHLTTKLEMDSVALSNISIDERSPDIVGMLARLVRQCGEERLSDGGSSYIAMTFWTDPPPTVTEEEADANMASYKASLESRYTNRSGLFANSFGVNFANVTLEGFFTYDDFYDYITDYIYDEPPLPVNIDDYDLLMQSESVTAVPTDVMLVLTSEACSSVYDNTLLWTSSVRYTTAAAWNASDAGQVEGHGVLPGDVTRPNGIEVNCHGWVGRLRSLMSSGAGDSSHQLTFSTMTNIPLTVSIEEANANKPSFTAALTSSYAMWPGVTKVNVNVQDAYETVESSSDNTLALALGLGLGLGIPFLMLVIIAMVVISKKRRNARIRHQFY